MCADSVGSEVAHVLVFPVHVDVFEKFAFVGSGDDDEAAVFFVAGFEGGPGGDDFVCRTEWEVEQILVEGVAAVDAWGFVDQHVVDRLDVGADEAFDPVEQ